VEEVEQMTGTYEHTIDGKGRLFIPSRLKEKLGDSFYLAMGADQCLTMYPQKSWDELCQRAELLEDDEDIEAMEVFFSQTYHCTVDSQNRIVIPAVLREYAELEKEVTIVGANRVTRIWNAKRWSEKTGANMHQERMKSLTRKVRL
jgi:MraZ protein